MDLQNSIDSIVGDKLPYEITGDYSVTGNLCLFSKKERSFFSELMSELLNYTKSYEKYL